jgi:hypothetical protein
MLVTGYTNNPYKIIVVWIFCAPHGKTHFTGDTNTVFKMIVYFQMLETKISFKNNGIIVNSMEELQLLNVHASTFQPYKRCKNIY